MNAIHAAIKQSIAVKQRILENEALLETLDKVIALSVEAFQKGNKVLFCGNGGSAADAQHIATELICRFRTDRLSLPGIALTTDTSALTAISNDFGYQEVFARQLAGLSKPGDVIIAITTSGNSPNIIRALEWAQNQDLVTIGLLGKTGGAAKDLCDHTLIVPHHDTARIQEMHILIGHIICAWVDEKWRS